MLPSLGLCWFRWKMYFNSHFLFSIQYWLLISFFFWSKFSTVNLIGLGLTECPGLESFTVSILTGWWMLWLPYFMGPANFLSIVSTSLWPQHCLLRFLAHCKPPPNLAFYFNVSMFNYFLPKYLFNLFHYFGYFFLFINFYLRTQIHIFWWSKMHHNFLNPRDSTTITVAEPHNIIWTLTWCLVHNFLQFWIRETKPVLTKVHAIQSEVIVIVVLQLWHWSDSDSLSNDASIIIFPTFRGSV